MTVLLKEEEDGVYFFIFFEFHFLELGFFFFELGILVFKHLPHCCHIESLCLRKTRGS
jgi:hypothetical protein